MRTHSKQIILQRTLLVLVAVANVAQAAPADLRNWHCPYSTDGNCPPNRSGYGLYQTKWSRWPGVTDADYQSRLPSPEPAKPAPPAMPAQEAPEDFMLPPSGPDMDAPPRAPSNNDLGPPPLTPEDEPRPDILSPEGEDILDELIPQGVRPPASRLPEPQPSTQRPSAPPQELPFEDQADPFKDDPLFNDDPPAPPQENQRSELPTKPSAGPLLMPAMRVAPTRLPAAQTKPFKQAAPLAKTDDVATPEFAKVPQHATAMAASAEFAVQPPAPQAATQNPLRNGMRQESRAVIPTAAWQESASNEASSIMSTNSANPLRR